MPQKRCREEYIVPAEYRWIKSHLRKDPERGKWASGLERPEILQELRRRTKVGCSQRRPLEALAKHG